MTTQLRIATRKSKLALWQANFVKQAIEKKYPHITVTLVEMLTEGDQQQTSKLSDVGGKSLFVKSLQNALLKNQADIAVHSMKDMSVYQADQLTIAAVCERANAQDALISTHYADIDALPRHAVVGTSSPRRTALIKSLRPDVQIKLLRGNVDTRLAKCDANEYDAIILAAAGLDRLGLSSRIAQRLSEEIFTPAIAQGAIAIECRQADSVSVDAAAFLHHLPTAYCVTAERAVNQILGGDCHTAIGAHAKIIGDQLHLSAMIGSEEGDKLLRASECGDITQAQAIGESVAENLIAQGARQFL